MGESIEDRCPASFDCFFEGGSNSIEIIQQIECDAIEAYENVMSQRMLLLFGGVLKTLFDFVTQFDNSCDSLLMTKILAFLIHDKVDRKVNLVSG